MEPLTDAQEAAAILCCGKDRREIVAIVAGQVATIAAERERIEAAERVVCAYERMISWEVRGCGKKTHEVPAPWFVLCEELDVALTAYRKAYLAKKER